MANNSRTKNSVINLITSMGGQLLSILMRFVVRTVFIRTLGAQYLGINGLFADILTMLSLTELGIDTAINFQLYKPLANKDDKRVRVLLKFYKLAYRVIGLAILLLGVCLIPLLPHLIRDYDSLAPMGINATVIFLLYLMQSVSSYLFFAYRSVVMRANQKKYVLDVADYAVTLVANVVKILVLIFFKDFVLYTASALLFYIIQNLVNAVIAQKYYPGLFTKEEDSLSREEIKGLFQDCGAIFVYKVNAVVLKATDNLVLSKFIGLTMVGLYSNYLLFCTTIKTLLSKVYAAVSASMGNLFATSDMEKRYRFFQIMNYLTFLLYGTAGVGLAVCSDELIRVWVSDTYVIPQPFATLIGLETLMIGLVNNMGQIRNVSGVFRQMWFRPVLGIVINLVVSVALVQVCGIYGVILGTIVSLLLTNFLVDPSVIHKHSFQNYRPVSEYYKKNLLYLAVLAAVCAADMWLCSVFFVDHGWFSVIVHGIIVAVSVPAAFVGLFWRSHECRYLVQLVKRIVGKVLRRGKKA